MVPLNARIVLNLWTTTLQKKCIQSISFNPVNNLQLTNNKSSTSTVSNEHDFQELNYQNNPDLLYSKIKLPCKCGSNDHQRTNHSSCILNNKNKKNLSTEEINQITETYNRRLIDNYNLSNKKVSHDKSLEKERFFGIAKRIDFCPKDVFGKNVQEDPLKPNYGRHIIPSRNKNCSNCTAWVWDEEKTSWTKKIYNILFAAHLVKFNYLQWILYHHISKNFLLILNLCKRSDFIMHLFHLFHLMPLLIII